LSFYILPWLPQINKTLKTNKFKGAKLDEMTRGLYGGTSFHTIHLHERRYFNRHV